MTVAMADLSAGIADHPHPRLLWAKGGEAALRARVKADPVAAMISEACMAKAERVLKARVCRYEIPDGKRLLGESRRALDHVMLSAWAWRMTGEERFRQRTIRELDAACGLKDWNPRHFLDTAEMATAVAIGYDWLFDTLTPAQRKRYEDAMLEKALKPARKVYESHGWWSKGGNNWSQVCGAGIAMAAAAVAERDPALCGDLFERGKKLIGVCTRFYEPDGVYPEGPGYWGYGTTYHVLMLAECRELGDGGQPPPVFRRSGEFMMQVAGPSGKFFNYADCGLGSGMPMPPQLWIARQFRDPVQSRYLRDRIRTMFSGKKVSGSGGRFGPLSLFWLPEAPDGAPLPPRAAVFRGEQSLAFFRTRWEDPKAAWLAMKGGTPRINHCHMDTGSFVYEAKGVRWFHDMGADDYNMPGYFDRRKQRWTYFRMTNLSHNTLSIGGRLQTIDAQPARITKEPDTSGKARRPSVAFDLSPSYRGQAKRVVRRAEFDMKSGGVLLEDRIEAPVDAVRWAVVTRAKVTIHGRTAVLEEAGKTLKVTRLDEAGGVWEVLPAKPANARENQNKGYRMLSFTAPKADALTLRVRWE